MSPTQVSLSQPPSVVAVVEDDASLMSALGLWLDMRKVFSLCCPDADGLLMALTQGPHGWSVRGLPDGVSGRLCAAIVDLNLPGMNGLELAKRLLQFDPTLRIMLITAARWQEDPRFHKLPPGISCLSKPFLLEEVEDFVLGPPA
jgi:DNA-binding response OmpR family regulator